MFINNMNILQIYNAILTVRDIQACNVVTYDEWLETSFDPRVNKQKEGYSAIVVKLLIEGTSEDEILLKISSVLKICEKGELRFSDLKFSYNVILEKHQERMIYEKAYEITLNFKSTFKLSEEKIININREISKNISVKGNLKVPIILEVIPTIDIIDLRIDGLGEDPIILKKLNSNKKIILNTIEGTVIQEGKNKFADTDMWQFPFLVPGENTIILSKDSCNVAIKYKERFL